MDTTSLAAFILSFAVLIFSIILHEIAHGWVAYRFGDWTAKLDGRLTLNPIPHIDPVGTIALPVILAAIHSPVAFGWAKPVPVHFHNLRGGERDYFWVSLAGIIVNACLALIGAGLFRLSNAVSFTGNEWLGLLGYSLVSYNVLLALFNLVPIPPLDGSRLLRTVLPPEYKVMMDQLESMGFFLLFFFLLIFQSQLGASVGQITHFLTGF